MTSKDLNIFQIVLIAVFLVMGIIGIAFFATGKVKQGSASYQAVIWGVLPQSSIDEALQPFRIQGKDPSFTYVEYPEEGFEYVLLKAIAEGKGPDAIIFPDYMYYSQMKRLLTIPNDTVSAESFRSTYLDIGNIFTVQDGVKAFPLIIDPLVMYYNIDMFTSENVLTPPKDWTEFANLTEKVVRRRDNGIIDKAYAALGGYDNINHAKDIIFAMLSQVGVNLSQYDANVATYQSGLNRSQNTSNSESASKLSRDVLLYYTEFANPTKSSYTWNKSFKSSRESFLSGDLATYFGPGSEIEYIRTRNPNLNFAIAPIPQAYDNKKVTKGKVYAMGFLITSKNPNATYQNVMTFFGNYQFNQYLSSALGLASTRRDVLSTSKDAKSNADIAVINNSAIFAKTWLDPDYKTTDDILSKMIFSIVSGTQNITDSIIDASDRLDRAFNIR